MIAKAFHRKREDDAREKKAAEKRRIEERRLKAQRELEEVMKRRLEATKAEDERVSACVRGLCVYCFKVFFFPQFAVTRAS